MHRSSSTTRASEEFFVHASSPPSKVSPGGPRTSLDGDDSPTYNPLSDVAKRERSRLRSAENAVHLIPFVLLLCAIILWFFSHPAVDMVNKGDPIVARIEGLTIDGIDSKNHSDSTRSGLLLEDLDPPTKMADHKAARSLKNKLE
ncbi:hypothetical protein HHK36_028082 [Tetracentron sinense]|uniref:Transmembrane protein n=1 Tax=Tetracentron sinense TaxID=13715 RepID=A0A834YFY0_TETSI|nr:hypothetical protein HHK36_028082 [Tetracentron sinense]